MGIVFNPFTSTFDFTGSGGSGSGDVVGTPPTTTNAIARYTDTSGVLIKNSPITIADNGDMAGVGTINTLVLPTSNFVGINDSQTLTNKTLTSPIISTISNTGTLTLPTSTDTIVGRATTDTFTNKTITSSTNVLGGVTMTLGSDADGDMYYRSSNVLTRLAKGTAAQVLQMNAGATAPEWATPSSGATTPRMRFTITTENNSLSTSTEGRNEVASSGAGASTAYSTATGIQLVGTTASGTTGYALTYPAKQRNGQYIESVILDKNPTLFARCAIYSNTGHKTEFGIGHGSLTGNNSYDGTVNKTLCFRFVRTTAAGLLVYAVSGTGSAETATDITTAASGTTGWNTAGTNYDQLFVITYDSGTEAKYYINGTLMATHTTNLPTGTLPSANEITSVKIQNNADTSASSQVGIYSMFIDYDAY